MARLAEQVLNQVLEAQATEQFQTKPYERNEDRQGYRNGHRDKPLNTRVGRLVLTVPRLRSGECLGSVQGLGRCRPGVERAGSLGAGIPVPVGGCLIIRVRKGGRVRLCSVLLATGINREGYQEILGLMIGDSESEATWSECFGKLKARGLTGVDLVVSDDHKGLENAVKTHFQGATWQRCQTHFIRNLLDACPKAANAELAGVLKFRGGNTPILSS